MAITLGRRELERARREELVAEGDRDRRRVIHAQRLARGEAELAAQAGAVLLLAPERRVELVRHLHANVRVVVLSMVAGVQTSARRLILRRIRSNWSLAVIRPAGGLNGVSFVFTS